MDVSEEVDALGDISPLKRESLVYSGKNTTRWRLIMVTGLVSALNAVQNSIVGMGAWPYMKEIDDDATAPFFGFSQSASKCVHAVFALLFSFWSYKAKSVRTPMLVSRAVSVVACIIYLGIEYVPTDRRYVMMAVFALFSISNSAFTVLRGYIVVCSSAQDRSKAFATIGLAVITSIIVAPVVQLLFSGITYPGYQIFPGLRFHVFTGPIWFSLLITVTTVIIIVCTMEEIRHIPSATRTQSEVSEPLISMKRIRETFRTSSDTNWRLIFVCLLVKIGFAFLTSTLSSVMSIIFMVQYGWSGSNTVRFSSVMMAAFGLISCSVLVLYIFCRLGERVRQEKLIFACLFAFCMLFAVTYPHPFDSQPLVPYNSTARAGCNPEEFSWCESARAVNPYLLMTAITVVLAPTLPMLGTAFETVYSKVLGTIDQSVAQGIMAVVGDVVAMITPVFVTTVFSAFGVSTLWTMMSSIFLVISAVWFLHLKGFQQQMSKTE